MIRNMNETLVRCLGLEGEFWHDRGTWKKSDEKKNAGRGNLYSQKKKIFEEKEIGITRVRPNAEKIIPHHIRYLNEKDRNPWGNSRYRSKSLKTKAAASYPSARPPPGEYTQMPFPHLPHLRPPHPLRPPAAADAAPTPVSF